MPCLVGKIKSLVLTLCCNFAKTESVRGQQALLPGQKPTPENILDRPLGDLQLKDVLSEVARHYLTRALEASNGNKVHTARMVGLSNYQTFTNWLKRYGIEEKC